MKKNGELALIMDFTNLTETMQKKYVQHKASLFIGLLSFNTLLSSCVKTTPTLGMGNLHGIPIHEEANPGRQNNPNEAPEQGDASNCREKLFFIAGLLTAVLLGSCTLGFMLWFLDHLNGSTESHRARQILLLPNDQVQNFTHLLPTIPIASNDLEALLKTLKISQGKYDSDDSNEKIQKELIERLANNHSNKPKSLESVLARLKKVEDQHPFDDRNEKSQKELIEAVTSSDIDKVKSLALEQKKHLKPKAFDAFIDIVKQYAKNRLKRLKKKKDPNSKTLFNNLVMIINFLDNLD